MVNFGTDFNSDFIFKDGDLVLVSDEENLVQSICNRLNTKLGSMDIFYLEYGSYIHTYVGDKKTDRLLDFISVEVRTVLKQDPRLQDATVNCEYNDKKEIIINISDVFEEDDEVISLVITDDYGVDIIGSG